MNPACGKAICVSNCGRNIKCCLWDNMTNDFNITNVDWCLLLLYIKALSMTLGIIEESRNEVHKLRDS